MSTKLKRSTFLKQSAKAGAFLALSPFYPKVSALPSAGQEEKTGFDESFLQRLVKANDREVENITGTALESLRFSRKLGYMFTALTAAFCSPTSAFYRKAALIAPLNGLSRLFLKAQTPDGTVNIGNLESPPDTAFLVELITAAMVVLQKEGEAALQEAKDNVKTFLVRAGDGLSTGGVHTPNHRWVISAALARIHALYPNNRYLGRIDAWLAEGIAINKDGNYPERSRIYSYVENQAFLAMARLLNRPALLEPVRKNLETTYYYMEPDGELVTVDSRRQDQYGTKSIIEYYPLYRYLAIRDKNGLFGGVTRLIENLPDSDKLLARDLIHFLEEPLLQEALPAITALPVNYQKLLAASHLLRIRRDQRTASFFGGVDWPLIIASGRSNSPNFFAYRNGAAVLKYLRLSTQFFSTGYFYSEGLQAHGGEYRLSKTLEVPYYQPLPPQRRRKDGDYRLSQSIDGRFWNKMDFENRPVSNVKKMATTITLTENSNSVELDIRVSGIEGVPVTLELCFKEGGSVTGIEQNSEGIRFLEKGMGTYSFNGDTIQFGPGSLVHQSVDNLEGERYSTHFGSLRTEGMQVYLTGATPFQHKLIFR